jgi:pimeloyl-ACP methyl ester carboxylesterase
MAATRPEPSVGDAEVREQALQLGPEGHLVGVLARPEPRRPGPSVIFLNAGVIHRVGPHRLHVNLARRLATRGVLSLRLDLSGIGDSRPVPGALSFRDSAVADSRAAMDHLAAEGLDRFVLFGLCSGADNAIATGLADPRVAGLVLIDPPAYVTRRARLRGLWSRARRLRGREVAERALRKLRARLRRAPTGEVEYTGGREIPPPSVHGSQLRALCDRGVAILSIYTGALGERYNHPDQLFELFPELRGRVERRYFPDANHMFTELDAQAALIDAVTGWVLRR